MEISGVGKSPNSSLSFRYNANNEELEELFHVCEDDPPTPQCDPPPGTPVESASPKRGERSSSIIDKYFKSMRSEKVLEKLEDAKPVESKQEEVKPAVPKEVTSSPMKEYLNRLGKRSTPDVTPDVKEGSNETWKLFHDFKFKIAQAVEDMKTRSVEDTKEKSIPRENSASDSEENSAIRDLDKESVGDTDNQVSSLDSSLQNLSDMTQPLTAKATDRDPSIPADNKNYSDSSDDTHKNLAFYNEAAEVRKEVLTDTQMEVESGVEALEDTIDSFGGINNVDPLFSSEKSQNLNADPLPPPPPSVTFGPPPSKNNNKGDKMPSKPNHFCSFSMYFFTFLILLSFTLFPNSNIWNGFVLGLWSFCFTSSLKNWVLDTYFSEFEPKSNALIRLKRSSAMPPSYTIPSVKEHTPIKKYEGWINHYRFPDYDPHTYHINKTTTAFMKLEGCNLRISYTSTKIPKRALWDEKLEKVAFYQHRLYNLTGAKVLLMPVGIVKRRQWSKKYPICVILSDNEKIQVLEKENFTAEKKAAEIPLEKKKEQHEMETETNTSTNSNTSPEKKRKFVWRRREKSTSHSDGETGKEGLRHRLVRKMHRDKKTDTVSTGTEPAETQSQSAVPSEKAVILDDSFHERESDLASKSATSTKDDDDDFDDTEMSKIKDLLEETEREIAADGTSEGEWSLHVKYSKDRHSYLFLFGRTGRDKHEWYRRLVIAITDANAASPENSATEDKSGSEPTTENKDNVEMAVYKVTEKEAVAFNKSSNKTVDSLNDGGGVTITSISQPIPPETDYEKIFWPYLLKIIETHDMTASSTSEKAVTCQIEPTPRDKPKNKKKRKDKDNKNSPSDCNCRLLPSEVTWVNTMMARVMFDMMRDPIMINRLQNRIQRKLNTLKLPAFMSPLVVTELSLVGACPLVERVAVPTWDARGVWLDADIRYDGGAFIAILTQINLMKLKEKNLTLEEQLMPTSNHRLDMDVQTTSVSPDIAQQSLRMRKPAIYDSEVEDSAESSDDDETPPVQPVDSMETVYSDTPSTTAVVAETSTSTGTSSKKKFLRMVDKIATNKYFQQVTDYKYVKRAMEGLSNTDIKLHLEVQALEGRLTFNLPPPPHDRIWLGFRTNPQLVLKARPAVGARTLRFAHITNWIEQKLSKEFEKILVLPNMEDFVISIMTPTPVQYP